MERLLVNGELPLELVYKILLYLPYETWLDLYEANERSFGPILTDPYLWKDINVGFYKNFDLVLLSNFPIHKLIHTGIYYVDNSLIAPFYQHLTYLNCMYTSLLDEGIESLVRLTYLNCSGTIVTDKGLENLINLIDLNCKDALKITDKSIMKLVDLTGLNCSYTLLTDEGIKNLIKLTYLICSGASHITNEGVKNLIELDYLVCSNHITIEGIKNMTKLEYLDCTGTNITINEIRAIPYFKNLEITKAW